MLSTLRTKVMAKPMVGGITPRVPDNATVREHVVNNVQAILLAFTLSGFEEGGYSTAATIDYHTEVIGKIGNNVLKFYKYKVAAWVATALNEPPPPAPAGMEDDQPEVLLGGKAWMWQKLVKRTKPDRWQQIIATMMTVKRAMDRPSKKDLDAALTATFQSLTRKVEPQSSLEDLNWADETEKEAAEREALALEDEVRRTVREAFDKKTYTEDDQLRPFLPSTSANVYSSRSHGGAISHIMDSGVMSGLKTENLPLVEWRVEGKGRSSRVDIDATALFERFRVLMHRIVEGAQEEEPRVQLVALAEALKVRVISKGPPLTYTALKPLQRWMWRTLRNHRSGVFKLIGEEVSKEYLCKQLGKLKEGEKFLSGDYTDATNELNPRYSLAAVDEISKLIHVPGIATLFKRSLTGHLIMNPDVKSQELLQTWGQLMGSVTSFPILCLVNAAICRHTREKDLGRSLDLAHAMISVNGDDCVFRATPRGRVIWEQLARTSGMRPSLGKYFYSAEFLNINSAQFLVRPEYIEETNVNLDDEGKEAAQKLFLVAVPRINLGLLVGLGRSTSGKVEKSTIADWGTLNSISQNVKTLLNECSEEDRTRVYKSYLNRNWKMLQSTSLPWFLPEHLGGLGLPITADYKPSDKDLRLAAAVVRYASLPSKRPEGVSWKIWDYATKRVKSMPTKLAALSQEMVGRGGKDNDGDEEWTTDTVMGQLCVEAIFTQPFTNLYSEKSQKNGTLRKLERAVKGCMKHMATVEPYQLNAMPAAILSLSISHAGYGRTPLSHKHANDVDALFT